MKGFIRVLNLFGALAFPLSAATLSGFFEIGGTFTTFVDLMVLQLPFNDVC